MQVVLACYLGVYAKPYSIKPLLLRLPIPIRLAWSKCSKNVLYIKQVQRTHEPSLRTSDNGSWVRVALVDIQPLALACSAILYISSFSPKSTNSNINVNYTNKANLSISLRKSRFIFITKIQLLLSTKSLEHDSCCRSLKDRGQKRSVQTRR